MRNMIRLVTLLLAAASAVLIHVVEATHTTFKDCWMLFGGLDDGELVPLLPIYVIVHIIYYVFLTK